MASPLAILLSGAQQPLTPGRPGAVGNTDVGNIVAQSQQEGYQNYAAELQKQNATFGGLAALGGAGIIGFGPKLAGSLFAPSTAPIDTGYAMFNNGVPIGIKGVAPFADTAASDAAGTGAADAAAGGTSTALGLNTAADAGAAGGGLDATADAAASAIPYAAGTSVAADLAAPAAADAALDIGAAGAADAGGISLAALLPLLFGA